jgi:hypothetical protein
MIAGTAELNWYLNETVRVMLAAERTWFTGGVPGGDRAPELAVLTRLQFSF